MATNKLSVYLNVNGAEEAEAKLKRLGKYGDVALKGISTSAQPVNKSLISLNDTVGTVSKSMQTFAGLAGAYLGFQGIGSTIGGIIATNTEFQKLSASLEVVEKDAGRAAVILDKLDSLAVQTPYSVQSLTDAWIKLGALGLKPSEEALLSYGNTSSAMGKDIMQFIEAIADASTMEFERLKEFGIKAKQQGDEVSFTFQGITTTVKKNAEEIEQYLRNIGQTTFAGSMTKQMATIAGSVSNLGDNFARIQRTVGESGFNEALQGLYGSISDVVASSEDSAKGLGSALGSITNGATVLVKNLDVLKDAALAFGAFKVMQLGAVATTTAMAATTLATRNMAFTLAASSAIAGKAATAQIVAMTAMGTAARGLTAAMGLVGGPLGVIAIAGFSIYQFAKKSDSAAEASSKYATELKEVEKNAKSLTLATDKLNESTSKQTKLKLLDSIDEAKQAIADITDQIRSTEYTDDGFFTKLFNLDSAEVEILDLKQQLFEGKISIEDFRQTLTSMGEQDIKFRKPALKVNEMVNSLKAAELALGNYKDKLNELENPTIPNKGKKENPTPDVDFSNLDSLFAKTKNSKESIESLIAQTEKANSSVGKFESSMGASLDPNSWVYGALEGFDSVSEKSGSFASSTKQLVENAFSGMTDSLLDFAKTGKLSFTDLTNSIISDMLRMQIQQSITGPLSAALSSAFTSMVTGGASAGVQSPSTIPTPTYNASVLHVGGIPGATSMSRNVPSSLFTDVPRFHSGKNNQWLRQNEVPAILKDDEMVLSGNTVRKLSQSRNSGNSPNIYINIQPSKNTSIKTQQSEDTNGFNLDIIVEEIEGSIANNVSRNRGPLNDVLQQQFKSNGANY